jgi:hypothetical protein
MQFSEYHTKPYLQHEIGDCCIMFCDGRTDTPTYKVKTIYLQTYIESADIKNSVGAAGNSKDWDIVADYRWTGTPGTGGEKVEECQ